MEIQASVVPPEYAEQVWPDIEAFVDKALSYTKGRFTAQDIRQRFNSGEYTLWIAIEGEKIIGIIASHIAQYPQKKFLSCPIVSGEDFYKWKDPMLDILSSWARDLGCEGIEATARLGWARVFKDDGYEALWQTFQLPLRE